MAAAWQGGLDSLTQAIQKRRLSKLSQKAFMGDQGAMGTLMGLSPQHAQMIQQQQGASQKKARQVQVDKLARDKFGLEQKKLKLAQSKFDVDQEGEGDDPFDFGKSMEGKAYKYYAQKVLRDNPNLSPNQVQETLAQHYAERERFVNTPQGMMAVPGQPLPVFKKISDVIQSKVMEAEQVEEADSITQAAAPRPVFQRPIPTTVKATMAGNMSLYDAIKPLNNSFIDDYVGSLTKIGHDVKSEYGKRFGDSQAIEKADWWQAYDSMVANVRNQLFGASLTNNEQKSFAALVVQPTFKPELAKKNLQRQIEIVSRAIDREKSSLIAEKYNKGSIEAITKGFIGPGKFKKKDIKNMTPEELDEHYDNMSDADYLKELGQ